MSIVVHLIGGMDAVSNNQQMVTSKRLTYGYLRSVTALHNVAPQKLTALWEHRSNKRVL